MRAINSWYSTIYCSEPNTPMVTFFMAASHRTQWADYQRQNIQFCVAVILTPAASSSARAGLEPSNRPVMDGTTANDMAQCTSKAHLDGCQHDCLSSSALAQHSDQTCMPGTHAQTAQQVPWIYTNNVQAIMYKQHTRVWLLQHKLSAQYKLSAT